MMQACWRLTVKNADSEWRRLFPTSEAAAAAPGSVVRNSFTVIVEEVQADVVFPVILVGDDFDGGDELVAICETYAAAELFVRSEYGAHPKEHRIECMELRR